MKSVVTCKRDKYCADNTHCPVTSDAETNLTFYLFIYVLIYFAVRESLHTCLIVPNG
jgi:hypothetical protein